MKRSRDEHVDVGAFQNNAYKLEINDAITYLTIVKDTLHDRKEAYAEFVDVMEEFRAQRINTIGIIARVKELFKGHWGLLLGFNMFLPKGYEITISEEDELIRKKHAVFKEGIQFVNKIRTRFLGDHQVYKSFYDIMNMFQKNRKSVIEVHQEVAALFQNEPDMLKEFTNFLPDHISAAVSKLHNSHSENRSYPIIKHVHIEKKSGTERDVNVEVSDHYNEKENKKHGEKVIVNKEDKENRPEDKDTDNHGTNQLTEKHKSATTLEDSVTHENRDHQMDMCHEINGITNFDTRSEDKDTDNHGTNQLTEKHKSATTLEDSVTDMCHENQDHQMDMCHEINGITNFDTRSEDKDIDKDSVTELFHQGSLRDGNLSRPLHTDDDNRDHELDRCHEINGIKNIDNRSEDIDKDIVTRLSHQGSLLDGNLSGPSHTDDENRDHEMDMCHKISGSKNVDNRSKDKDIDKDSITELCHQGSLRDGNLSGPLNTDDENRDRDHEIDRCREIKNVSKVKPSSLTSKEENHAKPFHKRHLSDCERCTPSYPLLPENYPIPSVTQRTKMGTEVLNDHWVSYNLDYSSKPKRKNLYEESLFRCEDDRFELDMLLELMKETTKRAEELLNKIDDNSKNNTNNVVRAEDYFTILHLRCIERIYGHNGLDVVDVLKKNASLALPVILSRLKQKEDEWKNCRIYFNKVWGEVYVKNFHKALDHRSYQQDSRANRRRH